MGEQLIGLRRQIVIGSFNWVSFTGCFVGHRDPTLMWGWKWPSRGTVQYNALIRISWVRLLRRQLTKKRKRFEFNLIISLRYYMSVLGPAHNLLFKGRLFSLEWGLFSGWRGGGGTKIETPKMFYKRRLDICHIAVFFSPRPFFIVIGFFIVIFLLMRRTFY